ncbi:hypothetical protein RSAG8_13978, partial [Rhizoctonia solani AG-8 WAC10335]
MCTCRQFGRCKERVGSDARGPQKQVGRSLRSVNEQVEGPPY